MDTRHPHTIIDEFDLKKKSAAEQKHFKRITREEAEALREKSAAERADWLAGLGNSPIDHLQRKWAGAPPLHPHKKH